MSLSGFLELDNYFKIRRLQVGFCFRHSEPTEWVKNLFQYAIKKMLKRADFVSANVNEVNTDPK